MFVILLILIHTEFTILSVTQHPRKHPANTAHILLRVTRGVRRGVTHAIFSLILKFSLNFKSVIFILLKCEAMWGLKI